MGGEIFENLQTGGPYNLASKEYMTKNYTIIHQ